MFSNNSNSRVVIAVGDNKSAIAEVFQWSELGEWTITDRVIGPAFTFNDSASTTLPLIEKSWRSTERRESITVTMTDSLLYTAFIISLTVTVISKSIPNEQFSNNIFIEVSFKFPKVTKSEIVYEYEVCEIKFTCQEYEYRFWSDLQTSQRTLNVYSFSVTADCALKSDILIANEGSETAKETESQLLLPEVNEVQTNRIVA